MNKEEVTEFIVQLEKNRYKEYPSHKTSDKTFCKTFGKSKYEEDRSNYQIVYHLWDLSKYGSEYPLSFSAEVMVSRTINERIDLHLPCTEIKQVETLADSFFKWVEENIKQ